jgi:outer membrane protein TolC
MKRYFLVLILLNGIALAQDNPAKQLNATPGYSLTDTNRNFNIRERLVQLAMNNPAYEVSDRLTNIAQYQLRQAKGSWLGLLSGQSYANEYTIFPNSVPSNYVGYYPKYNFGLTLPFDVFSRIPNNVKIARENYMIAQANKNDKFRQIKADVLTKYEDYLLAKEKLELQIEITQDAYTNFKLAEDNFKKNVIKVEVYNVAYRTWIAEQISKLDLQRNFNVSKIDLEKIIGIKLDDVLKQN